MYPPIITIKNKALIQTVCKIKIHLHPAPAQKVGANLKEKNDGTNRHTHEIIVFESFHDL